MNLQALRLATMDWLDDPQGDTWNEDGTYRRLDRVIDHAYRELVGELERTQKAWNVYPEQITLTVTSSASEYVLEGTNAGITERSAPHLAGKTTWGVEDIVRKVIDVVRTDVSPYYAHDLVPFSERYAGQVSRILPYLNQYSAERVYAYRRSDAKWVVGWTSSSPQNQTVAVWFAPAIDALTEASDTPDQVAESWHHVIPLRAALLGMAQTGRSSAELTREYAKALADVRQSSESLTSTHKSRPL